MPNMFKASKDKKQWKQIKRLLLKFITLFVVIIGFVITLIKDWFNTNLILNGIIFRRKK